MPVLDRTPKTLSTETYVVVAEVQNLHIAGCKVATGDEISLNAAQARHWLDEQVIMTKADADAAKAAAAKPAKKAGATDGAAS